MYSSIFCLNQNTEKNIKILNKISVYVRSIMPNKGKNNNIANRTKERKKHDVNFGIRNPKHVISGFN